MHRAYENEASMDAIVPTRQALWAELSVELATPVDSTSSRQVARDTVLLLRAMGCEPRKHPSDAVLRDWTPSNAGTALMRWKKKLQTAFGTPDIGVGRQLLACEAPEADDPAKKQFPLPQTLRKPTVDRAERLARDTEGSRPTMNRRRASQRVRSRRYEISEDSSSSDDDLLRGLDYDDADLTEQLKRQIHELSASKVSGGLPRLEIATHLPLGNIKHYYGRRNKSERSMQWLRTFVYEMKGTHTPPNE
ncbi:unnamed protein product [Phytophthora lilii]|uniref:Unnamed protein product n=1 Tax=Phytophthora lilii TaxID=2077276 RepID=A0A9W6TNJ6_9STRA|nr:unnamed protein product [Phytophthora lilii]